MLSKDETTRAAINALMTSVKEPQRPIVFWLGAGVSAWADFPLWKDLASKMHSDFSRTVTTYEKAAAAEGLASENFPAVFQQIQEADSSRYFNEIAQTFKPTNVGPVYSRMLRALEKMQPLHILTTNVDEALEKSLSSVMTVQASDIQRIKVLMQQRQSFVCKLHGSVSSVESMIFTESDYKTLTDNRLYLATLRHIFSVATVVFLGYSLRDDYLINLLSEIDREHPLFGTGPHFVITPDETIKLPESVKQIKYLWEHTDRRDALVILEDLTEAHLSSKAAKTASFQAEPVKPLKSIYYLADLIPFGAIQTSQAGTFAKMAGESSRQFVVGDGFNQDEIQITNYSALHDLIVGLLCFDTVYFDLDRLAIVHGYLGSEIFWELLQQSALKVTHIVGTAGIIFPDDTSSIGDIGNFTVVKSACADDHENSSAYLDRAIRKHLQSMPGQEKAADDLFRLLANTAHTISLPDLKTPIPEQTRAALIRPSIGKLLGRSEATPYATVPRWLAFPVLRLARVMTIGSVCQLINASATRMIFGVEHLASAAFSSASGKTWADEAASYVLAGRFNSDVGAIVSKNPSLLRQLVRFRSSQAGETLRKEVFEMLQTNKGAQVTAAVNSGLNSALTPAVLEQARNQFSGLFIPAETADMLPAVWGDLQNGAARIAKWRERSRAILQEEMRKHNLQLSSTCPCGSGEQLRSCCWAALTESN